ncbi:hypothetical protein RIR_jg33084.t1 [Rhizophagus irregularis DAOM 181602=DAOM 197198]|nr:hypothetical protein RIR_jg33084.t1 [Rhizophagus irregularis DAOM 181602=DAOM 197198]
MWQIAGFFSTSTLSLNKPNNNSITRFTFLHDPFHLRTFFQSSLDKTNIEWVSTRVKKSRLGYKGENAIP